MTEQQAPSPLPEFLHLLHQAVEKTMTRRLLIVSWFVLLACIQILILPRGQSDSTWFLYGGDTVSHDAIAQIWFWDRLSVTSEIPLWINEVRGGIPTIGSFFSTPFAPGNLLFGLFPFALAQKLQLILVMIYAGLGAYWLGRVEGLRPLSAVLLGTAFCLCGHMVTLIYPGHMQKILAIGWTPWFFGGLFLAFDAMLMKQRLRGLGVAGLALSLTFLSGHPQIAYGLMLSMVILLAWQTIRGLAPSPDDSDRNFAPELFTKINLTAGIVTLSLIIGAVQFLPGMEMKSLSNRAGGVPWDEAVATSYPPGELTEFFLPRVKGDSSRVGDGVYAGEWGQRLVSDYFGASLAFFVVLGLFGSLRNPRGQFWILITVISLLIGLGKFTPLYRILYLLLPGMDGFRSPGTFFFIAALGFARLGVTGFSFVAERIDGKPRPYLRMLGIVTAITIFLYMIAHHFSVGADIAMRGPEPTREDAENFFFWQALKRSSLFATFGGLVPMAGYLIGGKSRYSLTPSLLLMTAILAIDLSTANSRFLSREPMDQYQAFLDPRDTDIALLDEVRPLRVQGLDSPQSLRPILHQRGALLGYHPISYQRYESFIQQQDLNSRESRASLGMPYRLISFGEQRDNPDDFRFLAQVGKQFLVKDLTIPPAFYLLTGRFFEPLDWNHYSDNSKHFEPLPEQGTVRLLSNNAPGWYLTDSGGSFRQDMFDPDFPFIVFENLPDAEMLILNYEPRSFRIGLFLTLVGLIMVLYLFLATVDAKNNQFIIQNSENDPEKST